MSKQIINIGNSPNDGNGEPARSAFNKTNKNFDEIYSYLGDGLNLNKKMVRYDAWDKFSTTVEVEKDNYTNFRLTLKQLSNTTIGKYVCFQSQANGSNFDYIAVFARNLSSDNTANQIEIRFPMSSGTLALSTSDETIKEKVKQVNDEECIHRLKKLELWNYRLKIENTQSEEMSAKIKRGFMAQQVNAVDAAYALEPIGETGLWGIDDRAIIADLVGAIRVLKAEIDQLKGNSYEPQQ